MHGELDSYRIGGEFMNKTFPLMLTAIFIVCSFNYAFAQDGTRTEPQTLSEVTLKNCSNGEQIRKLIDTERKKGARH